MALLWAGFIFVVLIMLIIDLGVFHKESKEVSVKDALAWTVVWATLGMLFSIFVFYGYENKWMGLGETVDAVDGVVNGGWAATLKYLTGYVVEKSLSLDNIFVIAMIFGYFSVPKIYQHRVLFWGILGALLMRGAMIYLGAKLISEFHWILYIFGLFLILTAIKMLFIKTESNEPEKTFIVRLARRFLPITEKFHGEHFIVKAGSKESLCGAVPGETALPDKVVANAKPGKLLLTPLALTLIIVETTDLIFAVDSIPAIFAITADPYLIFTSNVFAIMGLRSLYFALSGMMDKFRYLKVSLALVLLLVGVKMLAAEWLKLYLGDHFNFYLLGGILLILASGVVISLLAGQKDQ